MEVLLALISEPVRNALAGRWEDPAIGDCGAVDDCQGGLTLGWFSPLAPEEVENDGGALVDCDWAANANNRPPTRRIENDGGAFDWAANTNKRAARSPTMGSSDPSPTNGHWDDPARLLENELGRPTVDPELLLKEAEEKLGRHVSDSYGSGGSYNWQNSTPSIDSQRSSNGFGGTLPSGVDPGLIFNASQQSDRRDSYGSGSPPHSNSTRQNSTFSSIAEAQSDRNSSIVNLRPMIFDSGLSLNLNSSHSGDDIQWKGRPDVQAAPSFPKLPKTYFK